MINPPQSTYAAAWMTAVPGRTPDEAARHFGVNAALIEKEKYRQYSRVAFVSQMPDVVSRVRDVLEKDEATPARQIGKMTGVPVSVVTKAMHVIQFEDLRRKYAEAAGALFEPASLPDRMPATRVS